MSVEKMLVLNLKPIGEKIQTIIVSTTSTIRVGRNFLVLWGLICLSCFIGCLLLTLVPFAYTPEFAILEAPFFNGKVSHVRQVLQKLANVEEAKVAKAKGIQRKQFLRHSLEKRKNVRRIYF
jgi:hypothetical protein